MNALILAAGRGSRLHPMTADCPKCLTELAGVPLIDFQIAALRQCGIRDVVVAAGYKREMLTGKGTRMVINERWASTNMVETLFAAEAAFGDDVVVSYSDIVYEPSVVQALVDSPHDVSVVVDKNWRSLWEARFENPLSDAESLRIDAAGRLIEIGKPAASLDEIQAQYVGLMRFKGDGIRCLRDAYQRLRDRAESEKRADNFYMTDVLMEMISLGTPVHGTVISGGWLEVDTISDYTLYSKMVGEGTIHKFFDPTTVAVNRS